CALPIWEVRRPTAAMGVSSRHEDITRGYPQFLFHALRNIPPRPVVDGASIDPYQSRPSGAGVNDDRPNLELVEEAQGGPGQRAPVRRNIGFGCPNSQRGSLLCLGWARRQSAHGQNCCENKNLRLHGKVRFPARSLIFTAGPDISDFQMLA